MVALDDVDIFSPYFNMPLNVQFHRSRAITEYIRHYFDGEKRQSEAAAHVVPCCIKKERAVKALNTQIQVEGNQ